MSTETPIDDEDPSIVLGRGIDALRLRAETAERELAAANAALAEMTKDRDHFFALSGKYLEQLHEQEAALAAARVNEARYLWLRQHSRPSADGWTMRVQAEFPTGLDAAIDAARSVPQCAK